MTRRHPFHHKFLTSLMLPQDIFCWCSHHYRPILPRQSGALCDKHTSRKALKKGPIYEFIFSLLFVLESGEANKGLEFGSLDMQLQTHLAFGRKSMQQQYLIIIFTVNFARMCQGCTWLSSKHSHCPAAGPCPSCFLTCSPHTHANHTLIQKNISAF